MSKEEGTGKNSKKASKRKADVSDDEEKPTPSEKIILCDNGETSGRKCGKRRFKKEKLPKKKRKIPRDKPPKIPNQNIPNCEPIDCTAKSTSHCKHKHIMCWNVDGAKSWIEKGGLNIFKCGPADIICLTELNACKCTLPSEMRHIKNYESYFFFSEKPGYAGVALFSKIKPIDIKYGVNDKELDIEGRCITAEFEPFYFVGVYAPYSGRELMHLPRRTRWNEAFKTYVLELDKKKPVVIGGDMNVAHNEIDVADPTGMKKNMPGLSKEERDALTDLLSEGYIDAYRHFYPCQKGAFTYWPCKGGEARSKNMGWRLDYFIVSERFLQKICDSTIDEEILGSDHCPISLYLDM